MALTAGARLGVYEIVAPLGAGGMGEVYRARDTKLDRDVALKILPESFASDRDRLMRFEREAKTLAALNHPHIAHIYGLEERSAAPDDAGGAPAAVRALVMELVEGDTLADRIARRPIAPDEALPLARQIAEALEAAHDAGIIHRDLKPANIKVRPDGTVKVLDFGLAKALDQVSGVRISGSGSDTASPVNSPTITSPAMTQMGVILGTAAYMSPEQARGHAVDERADIWAFGCVLFEMLSGARAFAGDGITDTLASVLRTPPNWSALPACTPPGIRRLLRRALAKDPQERLRSMADARLEICDALRDADDESAAPIARTPAPAERRPRWWALGAAAIALAALAGLGGWTLSRQRAPNTPAPAVTRLAIAPAPADRVSVTGNSRDVAISPDGRRVAYVGANGTALLVRDLERLETTRLEVGGLPHQPFFSTDGEWVHFVDALSAIRRVPVRGGPVETLTRITQPGVQASSRGDFNLFAMYGAVYRVPTAGGAAERVAAQEGDGALTNPTLLPGGDAMLVGIAGSQSGIGLIDLKTGARRLLVPAGWINGMGARYLPTGHLVYTGALAGAVQRVPVVRVVGFDLERREIVGTPVTLDEPIFISDFGGYADFDVSDNGTLVYVPASARPTARRLVWVSRDGREEPIDLPVRAYTYPSISPDGRRVALDIRDQENDTWIWDVGRTSLRRLTFDRTFNQYAVWTPDGQRIVQFTANALFWQRADGSGAAERLVQRSGVLAAYGFSPDGTRFVFREDHPETGHDLMILSMATRQVEPLLQTRFNELNAEISPDGRWLAFESDESGAREIYVRPFPDVQAGRWQVSQAGGRMPLWAPGGGELFFVAPDGAMMAASIDAGGAFSSGAPVRLFQHENFVGGASSIGRTYDVSRDGRRFLMSKADGPPPALVVVLNWHEELKRRVPLR